MPKCRYKCSGTFLFLGGVYMANEFDIVPLDEDLSIDELSPEDVELITDTQELERLSDEAKSKQDERILALKESVMSTIDQKKLPVALKAMTTIGYVNDILTDQEVWDRVKENITKPSDLKYMAEAMKLMVQNVQNLTRTDSVNTDGDTGEQTVALRFTSGGSTTEVVVGNKKK